jgi:hypothetical protein
MTLLSDKPGDGINNNLLNNLFSSLLSNLHH